MPIRDGLGERHAPDGDRHVGAVAAVGGDERLVVHLVDVVAGEDSDGVARVVLEDVRCCAGPRRPCRDTTPPRGRARCTAGAA